jgi:hypothetical protein
MVIPNQEYSHLDTLIGGWFHEDYSIDGETLEQIIASYKKVYSVEEWRNARADIERFLQGRDDNQLKEDFDRLFQPGVDPEAWDISTRQWLLRIAELLE